jgi:hypothetical protein
MSADSRSLWADADVLEHLMPGVGAGDECDPRSSMASRAAEVEPGTGHTPTGVFGPAWRTGPRMSAWA